MALLTNTTKPSIMFSLSRHLAVLTVRSKPESVGFNSNDYSTTSWVRQSDQVIPKRPANAYIRFVGKERSLLSPELQKQSASNLSKMMGEKWSQLGEEEKQEYQKQYVKDQEEYNKTIAILQADGNMEKQLLNFKQENTRKRSEKAVRKAQNAKRHLMKELGRPKLPATGWMLFWQEQQKGRDTKNPSERMKELANSWKVLPDNEKEKYLVESKALREKYYIDLLSWKESLEEDIENSERVTKILQKLKKKRANLNKLNKDNEES